MTHFHPLQQAELAWGGGNWYTSLLIKEVRMLDAVLATFIFVFLFLLGSLVWWYLRPRVAPIVSYSDRFPDSNYSYRVYDETPHFNRENVTLQGQSDDWQRTMRSFGHTLANSHVKHIYFVHGTFAGSEAWGLLDTIKTVYPSVNKKIAATITATAKENKAIITNDNGDFTSQYVQLFHEAIGGNIACAKFNWSPGNHHIARLRGAVELLLQLGRDLSDQPQSLDKILLIGHSHGGQIFALLAHFMDWNELGKHLIEVAVSAGYERQKIYEAMRKVSGITLDYVTYGTPIFYSWPDTGYYRLLHIINHRGSSHLAGNLQNILTTHDGDYIQQLGLRGTDLLAATAEDRRLNRHLDEILGEGRNLKLWHEAIKYRMRIPPVGRTLLVNYDDSSDGNPNFHNTFFGHGAYTRYEKMLFNTKLITAQFYRFSG